MADSPPSSKRRRLNAPASVASATRSSRRKPKNDTLYDAIEVATPSTPSKSRAKSRVVSQSAGKRSARTQKNVARENPTSPQAEPGFMEDMEVDELDVEHVGPSPRQSEAGQTSGRKVKAKAGTKDEVTKNTPSRASRKNSQAHQPSLQPHDAGDSMVVDDLDEETNGVVSGTKTAQSTISTQTYSNDRTSTNQLSMLRSIALSKLTRRRFIKLQNLESEYTKVHQLLHATVTAGESNSLLLIGARGSGKTTMVNAALRDLSTSQKENFHTVRLNGFIQTDDKLALKEIWRQLGREMEISDAEESGGKSYADTLTMLLALLSHPDEIAGIASDGSSVAKSVIFIMDEFEIFASHARQTLLYNLLDIAQSRKAPIAVIGLTTRIDVTEALEKRVKSRFSHRYVHLSLSRTLSEFANVGKAALQVDVEELSFEERTILCGQSGDAKGGKKKTTTSSISNLLSDWNDAIETLFTTSSFLKIFVHPIFYTTKSVPALLSSLLLPVSGISGLPNASHFLSPLGLLTPPDSSLHILPSLSELGLSLLISACRLSIIHSTDTTNFPLAYAEYVSLASKARINSAASGALASGAGTRVFGKEVARREWEKLVRYGLLVPVTSGAFTLSAPSISGTGKGMEMVRVDVALEEIPLSVGMSAVMEKWCLQI